MGLANSDGCSWMPLTSIQRTAPLVSTPKKRVQTRSATIMMVSHATALGLQSLRKPIRTTIPENTRLPASNAA